MCGWLQRGELPRRAGFYGDSRKAATRSGSFSGLISVLSQRRTCVSSPPPTPSPSPPSPVNPTSMAGHKQPIKPGLARLSTHTEPWREKVPEHSRSCPLSPHKHLFMAPALSFLPSFTLSHMFLSLRRFQDLQAPAHRHRAPPLTPYADDGCVSVKP